MLKISNKATRTCCSSVFIVDFEQVLAKWVKSDRMGLCILLRVGPTALILIYLTRFGLMFHS